MRKKLLFLIFIGLTIQLQAQNLVKNPSFEEGAICDDSTEITSTPTYWKAIAGFPKYLNPSCLLSKERKTYIQAMKLPPAAFGDTYIGMGIDQEGEYIQGQLSKPLEKGKQYWIRMRVRLPIRFCNNPLEEIGMALTDSNYVSNEKYLKLTTEAIALKANNKAPIQSQFEWEEVSAIYTATGNELYLMIGNFASNNIKTFSERKGRECSYLYIDMVSVEEYKEVELKAYNPNSEWKEGERLYIKEIEFEPGLEKLKASSFGILDKLAEELAKKPTLRLEISGHTDNTNDESINKSFSEARAEAVVNYLIAKGAKEVQLITEGKGSIMNIAVNTTEAGRKKNNRIEIKVIGL